MVESPMTLEPLQNQGFESGAIFPELGKLRMDGFDEVKTLTQFDQLHC
jgi:hypothetical protein